LQHPNTTQPASIIKKINGRYKSLFDAIASNNDGVFLGLAVVISVGGRVLWGMGGAGAKKKTGGELLPRRSVG